MAPISWGWGTLSAQPAFTGTDCGIAWGAGFDSGRDGVCGQPPSKLSCLCLVGVVAPHGY